VTFNEKVRYKLLNDRRPLLTQWADKVAVRDYVERVVGSQYLTELYLVTDDPDHVREQALPREFALKPSHGSSACVVVGEQAPPENALPEPPVGWALMEITPERLDWDQLRGICREWLGLWFRGGLEWAYRDVPPRILVEELLIDGGSLAPDYKLFVFHGRVRLIDVYHERFAGRVRSCYSPEWRRLEVERGRIPRGPDVERPPVLAEMIRVAEALGEETDFVRVDLYAIGDRVVFGELTSYPGAGGVSFRPASYDAELGAWWSPPKKYR
jgi:TupA-like ATPgrasp